LLLRLCYNINVKPSSQQNVVKKQLKKKQTRNVCKKDKRRWIKKGKNITQGYILVHKSYTGGRKLKMVIVKDQWTAIVAHFVRMSLNSFKENYYLCNDRQRQEKFGSLLLVHKAHAGSQQH